MTADAMTHLVDGEAGIGPNAESDQLFWFERFRRGAQVAPNTTNVTVNESTGPMASLFTCG